MKSQKRNACSFCGKLESETRRVLYGPGKDTAICEECITFSETLIREQAPMERTDGTCSFCGKPSTHVERMVFGPGTNICNSCIAFARKQFDGVGPTNLPAQASTWTRWIARLRSLLSSVRVYRATTADV
jgi:ATP-dependent protease Clp ATPase subunit